MGMEEARAYLRAKAADVKLTGQGINIQAGAKYVLEVQGAKVFKGFKDPQQSVVEYKVVSATPTQAKEFYEKNGYPNQPGSSCSDAIGLSNDKNNNYKLGLFLGALCSITGQSIEEMRQPAEEGKPQETWEMFVEWDKSPAVFPLAGLLVGCEAYLDWDKDKTKLITKKKYTTIAPPEGHPLAGALAKKPAQ